MKKSSHVILISFFLLVALSACSNINEFIRSNASFYTNKTNTNPLKSIEDKRIEDILVGNKWLYQRQSDDCKDTYWVQKFYKTGYYKSAGSTCLLSDTFSVAAESWYVKGQIIYIMNLSPRDDEDIILKYGVEILDNNRIILRSATDTYTFIRDN